MLKLAPTPSSANSRVRREVITGAAPAKRRPANWLVATVLATASACAPALEKEQADAADLDDENSSGSLIFLGQVEGESTPGLFHFADDGTLIKRLRTLPPGMYPGLDGTQSGTWGQTYSYLSFDTNTEIISLSLLRTTNASAPEAITTRIFLTPDGDLIDLIDRPGSVSPSREYLARAVNGWQTNPLLVYSRTDDTTIELSSEMRTSYRWSPKGDTLFYYDHDDEALKLFHGSDKSTTTLSTSPVIVKPHTYYPDLFQWSPDGSKSFFVEELADGSRQVELGDHVGDNRKVLKTVTFDGAHRVDWARDGSSIAITQTDSFAVFDLNGDEVYSIDVQNEFGGKLTGYRRQCRDGWVLEFKRPEGVPNNDSLLSVSSDGQVVELPYFYDMFVFDHGPDRLHFRTQQSEVFSTDCIGGDKVSLPDSTYVVSFSDTGDTAWYKSEVDAAHIVDSAGNAPLLSLSGQSPGLRAIEGGEGFISSGDGYSFKSWVVPVEGEWQLVEPELTFQGIRNAVRIP